MRNVPVTLIQAVDTSTQTGAPIFVGQEFCASFTPVFGDSTVAGTVQIQGSNEIPIGDPAKYVPSNASFCNIPNATSTITSGVGPAIILNTAPFQFIRAVFTYTSGGNSTILVNGSLLLD
jgi:hypothetical protein